MTDSTTPPNATESAPSPSPAPAAPQSSLVPPITLGGALSLVGSLVGAAAGAGWPGVVALGLIGLILGIGVPVLYSKIINEWNAGVDRRDLDNAGADAGRTSVDISNQAKGVRDGLDQMQKDHPPTDGFSQPKN